MTSFLIHNARVLSPGQGIVADSLLLVDGRIAEIGVCGETAEKIDNRVDAKGRLLTPGLIDLHSHGIGPWIYEAGSKAMLDAASRPARYGTTSVLPTLFRNTSGENLPLLAELAEALDRAEGVCFPGFHFEGPFLAFPGAGCATLDGDVALLDTLIDAVDGRMVAMSISPDTRGILPVIKRLVERAIVPMITHTGATVAQTQAAIRFGARHATHFLNVFRDPEPPEAGVRSAGPVEVFLADPDCTVDMIVDGVHVDPQLIRSTIAAKGWQNTIFITDSMVGAGEPEGFFEIPDGPTVHVKPEGAARIHSPGQETHDWLCGSSLTMDRGVSNLLQWLPELEPAKIWAMGTSNPARLLKLDRKGVIEVGADADLVLWDETADGVSAAKTWVGGKSVFDVAEEV